MHRRSTHRLDRGSRASSQRISIPSAQRRCRLVRLSALNVLMSGKAARMVATGESQRTGWFSVIRSYRSRPMLSVVLFTPG